MQYGGGQHRKIDGHQAPRRSGWGSRSAAMVLLFAVVALANAAGCRGSRAKAGADACGDDGNCEKLVERCTDDYDDDEQQELARANQSCLTAGSAALARRDLSTANQTFGRACDRGVAAGCDGLAQLGGAFNSGQGAPRDPGTAFKLFHRACQGGSAAGCYGLGVLYHSGQGVTRSFEYAVFAFKKACDKGHAQACNQVAVAHSAGQGAAKDDAQAVVFYGRACDAGLMGACVVVGEHLEEGRGAPKDEFRAAVLYSRVCEGRDDNGCRKLAAVTQKNPAIAVYLENQRRMEAERRAREAEARAREAEARARAAEDSARRAQADARAEDERRAAEQQRQQQQQPQGPSTGDRVWGVVQGVAGSVPPPPAGGGGTTVQHQQRRLCYDHDCNGVRSGKKCFDDRGAYCRSLCAESNCLSKMACSRECG
jgi:hypothetical protein